MKILESEVYTGDLVQGKTKIVDHQQVQAGDDNLIVARHTHEPIISHAVFEAVQDYRKQVCEQSKAVPKKPYTPNIFKGKVFCADCGRSLHRQRAERKKGPDIYWFHCLTNSRVEKDSCKGVMIQETELIATVTSVLEKELTVALGMSLPLFQLEARQKQEKDKLRGQMSSKRQLYERYALGEIDLETYRSQKAVYDAELVQAKNVHAAITAQTKQIQSDYEARLKQREIVQEVGSTDVLTQSLIDRLINRVYVFPGDRIEIEYVTQDFLGTEKSGKEA